MYLTTLLSRKIESCFGEWLVYFGNNESGNLKVVLLICGAKFCVGTGNGFDALVLIF
jgi:hypothetical protein